VRDSHPDCRVVHVAEEVPQAPDESGDFWPIWTDLIARHAGEVTTVFTSEPYGDELAKRVGATHVAVDPQRLTVPVSGTAIRADPLRLLGVHPPAVRPYYALRVVLSGPSRRERRRLSERLARRFETVMVPEYGRPYCETRPALNLALHDFEAIAWGQATWETKRR
jgi:NadR type nicotinamide-nucleotide adenylyltransferase